jgi:hypothetical protein
MPALKLDAGRSPTETSPGSISASSAVSLKKRQADDELEANFTQSPFYYVQVGWNYTVLIVLKTLQIYTEYPIISSIVMFISNQKRSTLIRRSGCSSRTTFDR